MPANAAIYIPTARIDLARIFPDTKSNKTLFKKATYFEVPLGGDIARFNVMESSELEIHLNGFCGYIASLEHDEKRKVEATNAILQTKTVLGLITKCEFDENTEIWHSLFQIAGYWNGYVFVNDSVLLPSGIAVVGPMVESGTTVDQ